MTKENSNPGSTDRDVSGREQSDSGGSTSRREFLKVSSASVIAAGIGTAGTTLAAEGDSSELLVNNYDGSPAWPGRNDLGKWASAGGLANGKGEVTDSALRLEYDGGGWFGSNIGTDISAYDRLEFVVRGDSGGEEQDFQVKLGTTTGLLGELSDDSIGTSFSTVAIDLQSAGVASSIPSLRFNFWQGRSRSSAIEIEEIRFAAGSGDGNGGTDPPTCPTGPSMPTNLTVTDTTESSIVVDWDASSGENIDHYTVTAGGASMSVPAGTTQATIIGLESDTTYTVSVIAVGTAGNKSDAATVTATTDSGGEPSAKQTVSVQLSDTTINPDGTTTASIVLSEVPNGLAGYDLTVKMVSPSVATITDASIASTLMAPGGGVSIADDGSSVTLRAADLETNIQSGATDVTLATVTCTGQSAGSTAISLDIGTVDDDNGSSMSLRTAGATLTVSGDGDGDGNGEKETVSVQLSDSEINPDGTTTGSLMLSEAPNGLAGYDITVAVAKSSVATITDATIADDGSSVTLRAADLETNIQSGATDIDLATVTFTGQSSGSTQINVSIDTVDDDNGSSMSLSTSGATLTVSGDGGGDGNEDDSGNGDGNDNEDDSGNGDNNGGGSGPTVSVQLSSGTISPDGTTTGSLMLSEAPNGLAGYDITVTVANPSVATITDGKLAGSLIAPGGGVSIADDGSSVTLRAADLTQQIQSGATDIDLATVTFTGQSSGSTQINVSIDTVDDDNGSSMSVSTSGVSLTVS